MNFNWEDNSEVNIKKKILLIYNDTYHIYEENEKKNTKDLYLNPCNYKCWCKLFSQYPMTFKSLLHEYINICYYI